MKFCPGAGWSLCRCRFWCCERGDVSHGEINAQYRCNGAESMSCSTSRRGSRMLLTAQPRDEWFRACAGLCWRRANCCDTKRTPPHTSTKKTQERVGKLVTGLGARLTPKSAGDQGQLSAYVHLTHRVFGGNQLTSMARSCQGQQSSRLVSRQEVFR